MAGCYNGTVTIQELRSHGDTGIGTTHALDGELIAEGGRFYLARASGEVILLNDTMTVPCASVSWVEPDLVVTGGSPSHRGDIRCIFPGMCPVCGPVVSDTCRRVVSDHVHPEHSSPGSSLSSAPGCRRRTEALL